MPCLQILYLVPSGKSEEGIPGWIGFRPKGILMFCSYCTTEKEGGYWTWQTTNWEHFKRRQWHTWWSQPSCRRNQLSHRCEYFIKPKLKENNNGICFHKWEAVINLSNVTKYYFFFLWVSDRFCLIALWPCELLATVKNPHCSPNRHDCLCESTHNTPRNLYFFSIVMKGISCSQDSA